MKTVSTFVCAIAFVFAVCASWAQTTPAATDIYHVMFVKAAPGQNKGAEAQLKQDAKAPMPGHYLVLRHQEGDDWDYAVLEHIGKKYTIDPAEYTPPPANGPAVGAWHSDTFVLGPSWDVVSKQLMGGAVYVVSTYRAAPGHRVQLEKLLNATAATQGKIQVGGVLFAHIEGGPWNFMTISKYNSWSDFGADEAANVNTSRWSEARDHWIWHVDTVADRITPGK